MFWFRNKKNIFVVYTLKRPDNITIFLLRKHFSMAMCNVRSTTADGIQQTTSCRFDTVRLIISSDTQETSSLIHTINVLHMSSAKN